MEIPFEEQSDHPILSFLIEKEEFRINDLAATMNMPIHHLSSMLFELELAGHIKAFPGGVYKLNR
jgi:DNA processing protein